MLYFRFVQPAQQRHDHVRLRARIGSRCTSKQLGASHEHEHACARLLCPVLRLLRILLAISCVPYHPHAFDACVDTFDLRLTVCVRATDGKPGSAPGSVLWHGVELDDLSGLIESVTPDAQVISLLISPNVEVAELHGEVAAQASLDDKMRVKVFQYRLAFALTDFVSETGFECGNGSPVCASSCLPAFFRLTIGWNPTWRAEAARPHAAQAGHQYLQAEEAAVDDAGRLLRAGFSCADF